MTSQVCTIVDEHQAEPAHRILWSARGSENWREQITEHDQLTLDQVKTMLSQYRSRNIQQVAEAAEWFVEIDIRARITQLIEDLREGNLEEVENAKVTLASFSELGLKSVVALLDDNELHGTAKEILAEMDEHVLPHLIRWAERAESYNIRTGILQSLVGHLDDLRARKALADALRSPDPVEAALICRELLEAGPRGHQIIEIVFPEAQKEVA